MPRYRVTAPDGTQHIVNAPDGASMEDVLAYAKEQLGGASPAAPGDMLRNVVPTSPEQRKILEGELAKTRTAFDAETDPTRRQEHARNIIALQRTLAGKSTDFPPSDDPNPDYAAAVTGATASPEPASAPRASQVSLAPAEPPKSPMQAQRANEKAFNAAVESTMRDTGRTGLDITPSPEAPAKAPNEFFPGRRPNGPGGIRDVVSQQTGMVDPNKTREQAGIEELRQGGDVTYGDSLPYALAKGTAAVVGFGAGGPRGATAAEGVVRAAALFQNLKAAVDAGAITFDRAVEIGAAELANGMGEDALFNFGIPLLAETALKIPGVKPLIDKTVSALKAKYGAKLVTPSENQAAQAAKKVADRAGEAETPAGAQAVEELSQRMPGQVPTPGQVAGEAGWWEGISRKANPQVFGKQQDQLGQAAEGMRQDLLNPSGAPGRLNPTLDAQPNRQVLGQRVLQTVDDTERNLKNRLRPTFEQADNLGVHVDMQPVVDKARAAIARLERTNGHPEELRYLRSLVDTLENQHPANLAGSPMVGAADTLDMMSGLKEKLRSTTADWQPSTAFNGIVGDLVNTADKQYAAAAARAGRSDVVQKLLQARNDYREFMDTAYDSAFKTALRRQPEDVGRVFWQGGNDTEIQQFQKMLRIAQREGALGSSESQKIMRDMTRGFLQEAVPNVEAAANWSKTLAENPLRRDTWNALTSTPGGQQLKATMDLLEQTAKIASRDSAELLKNHSIPLFVQRAASGSAGYSPVTGAARPGVIATAFGLTGLTRLAATAYTQGNKGVANLIMRALRANSAGTAISAKVAQQLQDYASQNGISLTEGEEQ